MGITGLLPFVKKASSQSHVRKFSGCTVGIDAYVWLHKGAFGCAEKLGKGEPTTAYVNYCMKYINVLLAHNVKPILVLDGRNLPSKSETEKKRRQKREENRKNAKEFLRKGMKKEAFDCFTKCVDITPAMAREFIKVLRRMKIDYIVAPYEADSQLAFLAKKKIIDIVITEDSDLILFGCPKIFFKMNTEGHGVLFDASKLHTTVGLKADQFDFDRFRSMCILSGCDYLASLPGIGLGRAKKLIDGTSSSDIRKILMGVSKVPRLDTEVTEEYIKGFQQAVNTFLYQLVFDPTTRELVPLTPYSSEISIEDIPYAGSYKYQDLALGMALGNVDIHTLKVVDNFDPMKPNSGYDKTSMWHHNFSRPSANQYVTHRDLSKAFNLEGQTVSSVKKSIGKRVLTDSKSEENYDETNDDLLSLYQSSDQHDANTSIEVFESEQQAVKKIRTQDDSISEKTCETTKSKNPFLKFKFSKSGAETVDKTACSANLTNELNTNEDDRCETSLNIKDGKKSIGKRVFTDTKSEENYDETNEDLRSLYQSSEQHDANTSIDFFESEQQAVKRIKIQDDSISEKTTKSKNPFSKFKFSKSGAETVDKKVYSPHITNELDTNEGDRYEASFNIKDCSGVFSSKKILRSTARSSEVNDQTVSKNINDKSRDESDSNDDDECTSIFFKSSKPTSSNVKNSLESSNSARSRICGTEKSGSVVQHAQPLSSLNPICLVERNRIYEKNARTIVKSQYFKEPSLIVVNNDAIMPSNNTNYESINSFQKNDSTLSIYSLSKNEVDSGYSDETGTKGSDDDTEHELVQSDSFNNCLKETAVNQKDAPIVEITIQDDEPVENQTRRMNLQQYSKTKPLRKPNKASSWNSKSSRNSDPKQPSLKTLFARQEKQKI